MFPAYPKLSSVTNAGEAVSAGREKFSFGDENVSLMEEACQRTPKMLLVCRTGEAVTNNMQLA